MDELFLILHRHVDDKGPLPYPLQLCNRLLILAPSPPAIEFLGTAQLRSAFRSNPFCLRSAPLLGCLSGVIAQFEGSRGECVPVSVVASTEYPVFFSPFS